VIVVILEDWDRNSDWISIIYTVFEIGLAQITFGFLSKVN